MLDIFVNGGDEYGGKKRKKRKKTEIQRGEGRAKRRSRAKAETTDQTSHSSPKLRKWKTSVGISDQNKIPIIAFGDALFATSLKVASQVLLGDVGSSSGELNDRDCWYSCRLMNITSHRWDIKADTTHTV